MIKKSKIIIFSIAICMLTFLLIIRSGIFGVTADNIEQDARKSQKINSTWDVAKSINEKLGAMIFYNDTLDDYTYSIYVNRGGLSFGYFFRSGGSNSGIMDGIHQFKYDDIGGSALISMNKVGVARIDLDNGANITRIDIDPTTPFAVVTPKKSGLVTLYDVNENVVPITVVEANGDS